MRKTIAIVLSLTLAVCLVLSAVACQPEQKQKIVFLGDSIAEAIIGPSPLSERENYGYYAVLGKRNEYEYVNRSVSGHKTGKMLEYISRDDEDALMVASHLKTADIIDVSILGNDMLQSDVSGLLIEMVQEQFGEIEADDTMRENILVQSRINFADIIAKLKEINPDATILVQTVYNPIYAGSTIVSDRAKAILAAEPYNCSDDDLRRYGNILLSTLNDVVFDYDKNHPGDIHIVDVCKAFGDIYDADHERGKNLIFPDGVHPSNEGHAVIADATQRVLEGLNLADEATALRNYKQLRLEQLKRLYSDSIDYSAVKTKINDSNSVEKVTELYFATIADKTPALN